MSQAERNAFSYSIGERNSQGPHMSSALIVDDEPGIRSFLQKGLEKRFSLVEVARVGLAGYARHGGGRR